MSSAFKEQMQKDISNIFLNVMEFSDMHTVNGKNIPAQVDESEAEEQAIKLLGYGDGVFKRRLILFVAESDFGAVPSVSSVLTLFRSYARWEKVYCYRYPERYGITCDSAGGKYKW